MNLHRSFITIKEFGVTFQDWYDCVKYAIDNELGVVDSSSVNHFIMDGAPYVSAYLYKDFNNNENWELSYEYMEDKIEFFVNKGEQLSWKELKEQYGHKNGRTNSKI